MVAQLIIVLVGLALLVLTVWAWRGRSEGSRWWTGTSSGRRMMLAVLPALGVLVFSGGVLALTEKHAKPVFELAAFVLALPMLMAMVLAIVGMIGLLPKWWGPKWYRDEIKDEGSEPFDIV